MIRRLKLVALVALVAIGMAAFAATASATPSKTVPCSNCHDGVGATIATTLTSTVGTTATYNVSAPGATAIAVFDGTTKLTTIIGNSGTFAVTTGGTYSLFAVTGPTTSDGLGTASVSPVAAPSDSTAPVTTSNAAATYVSSAVIKLTATDSGSGVAATYYKLDGGTQSAGTSIAVGSVGSHTIEFWSVDVAGNVETHKTASFTITAPVVVDGTAPVTTSNAAATYVSSAVIKLTATDSGSGVAATYYKLDGGTQSAGTSIAVGSVGSHTIEFWSVDVAGNVETHKTASFTITAPVVVDGTAPVTTSNAAATYVSSAVIKLTATDSGSGVAATYYKLDGGTQSAGTSIAVGSVGSHTIEFWSVDVAGNVETHKTASFTITAPAVVDGTATALTIQARQDTRKSDHKTSYIRSVSLSGKLTPGGENLSISLYVMKPGSTKWTLVKVIATDSHESEQAAWSYKTSTKTKGTYKFQVKFAGTAAYAASASSIATVKVR